MRVSKLLNLSVPVFLFGKTAEVMPISHLRIAQVIYKALGLIPEIGVGIL